ncbi:hypothetical protein SRB5_32320 [Streptomyces sp. RB5]|uniref:DoxX family membrane protein n=2 Tax=Streptomyces smaragdinus TaxID=2585196 RepID=A0A7K0CHX9_9ACTN|nr:hypothetical protein [Streptomyces smaragdinus]
MQETGALTMVRVPSDPARISVSNVSFRVRLGPSSGARGAPGAPGLSVARPGARPAAAPRVRKPVVWSGRSAPDDPMTGQLRQAVRRSGARPALAVDATATQLLPRIEPHPTTQLPLIGPQRGGDDTRLLPPPREFDGSSYDEEYDDYGPGDDTRARRHGADPVRHAYYPGRRMNLGVVLLPLRIFLGFVAICAGMGKLSDPLYFDEGERGRLTGWLDALDPWTVAQPLHAYAQAHPVGAGLTVAFLQIVVGVLTICGLWQRIAAGAGVLLAGGLIATISWRTDPSYDATEFIYLAAWSPLLIAGAPVYSLDARLAGQAWRRLGPRSALWELRRFVLRRGVVYATVIVGVTLLIGSILGSAVRSATTINVPGPGEPPVNHLPGETLPATPGAEGRGGPAGPGSPSPAESATAGASAAEDAAPSAGPTAGASTTAPGSDGEAPARTTAPTQDAPPSVPQPSTSAGGTTGGATPGGGSGEGGGTSGGTAEEPDKLLGGLLG